MALDKKKLPAPPIYCRHLLLSVDIKQLITQMTLEEKAKFCSGADFWHVEGLERLGIPSVMVTDGPCGLRKQAGETDHLGLNASVKAISYPTGEHQAQPLMRAQLRIFFRGPVSGWRALCGLYKRRAEQERGHKPKAFRGKLPGAPPYDELQPGGRAHPPGDIPARL